jgi:mannan endo-1,4-beta-mannosidase
MAEMIPNKAEQLQALIQSDGKFNRAELEALVKQRMAEADETELGKVRANLFRKPVAASATPAVEPATAYPPLPDLSLIWPTITGVYTGWRTGFATLIPHSSPQVVSDLALGLAVFTVCNSYLAQGPGNTNPWFYPSIALFGDVSANFQNIPLLPFAPKSMDTATVELWLRQQVPDFSLAELFPASGNSLAENVLWGMSCRQLLIDNGWDVSGITASTAFPINNATLTVNGRFLTGRHGNEIILRGIDLPLLDDYSFPGSDYLSELAQTGANCVRIQWYRVYPNDTDPSQPGNYRPAYTAEDLGNFLDRCVAANIIPILMLADDTCYSDPNLINSYYAPFYTNSESFSDSSTRDEKNQANFTAVLKARQACLIINLANELGYYKWTDDPSTALTAYVNAYKTAIASMRTAGYTCPLMIDAPDCGTTLDAFTSIGAELVAGDPLHNILLSTHAYWAGYDGRPFVAQAVAANLPIVFGEIANKQDETDDNNNTLYCYYDLDGTTQNHPTTTGFTYQAFLTSLLPQQVGWLAWSWFPDGCGARQMSNDGTFANLTAYGQDIVNNATYGLKATAVQYLP